MTIAPTPIYAAADVQLYCGDSRIIVPMLRLDPAGVVIVADPPYGWGHRHSGKGKATRPGGSVRRHATTIVGDDEPFDPQWMTDTYRNVLLWGANHYRRRLPEGGRFLVWDKIGTMAVRNSFSDVEYAWHSLGRAARKFTWEWMGCACRKTGESNGKRWHPNTKPIALMAWSIEQTKPRPGQVIIDPYCGAGPTLLAARRLGLPAIGIEIDRQHCATAVERLQRAATTAA